MTATTTAPSAAATSTSTSASSSPPASLTDIVAKAREAHKLLSTRTDHPLSLPASAPEWLRALAADAAFEYKDIRSILDVDNHLIYDSLFAHQKVTEFYYFVERPAEKKAESAQASTSAAAATTDGAAATSPASPASPEIRVVFRLGKRVCGHHNIVHGGLIAALMDEVSGACAFLSVGPGAFTANLNINYTKPVPAHTYVVVKARVTSVDRRKTFIGVNVVNGADEKEAYANGVALFVLPKWMPAAPAPSESASASASGGADASVAK